MKMALLDIDKAGRTLVKMDTSVDGQIWVVNLMTVPQNERKWYKIIFIL